MPGASISANLGGIIFKTFWESMPPDPLEGLKNVLGANLTPANSRKLTTIQIPSRFDIAAEVEYNTH